MKRSSSELIAHGIIGGVLAGLVVALWFLILDSIEGVPFRTPAALAYALYVAPIIDPTFRLVATYTVIHLGVYAALGVGAAWVMSVLHTTPRLLLGLFFGIVVQELVFYTGLFLGGLPPSEVIPWQHVIGANVLSGLVLMSYLHRAEHVAAPLGLAALKAYPQLTNGLITGVIGAGVVAMWFFLLDLVTFAVAGVVFVMIAEQVERSPSFLLLAAMMVIVLEGVVVAALALGAQWVLGTLGIWSTLVANLLAVASMGWYVWATHPVLRQRLHGEPLSVRV